MLFGFKNQFSIHHSTQIGPLLLGNYHFTQRAGNHHFDSAFQIARPIIRAKASRGDAFDGSGFEFKLETLGSSQGLLFCQAQPGDLKRIFLNKLI